MSEAETRKPRILLPNLGAEEGDDFVAYRSQPRVRAAAHLWALLYEQEARLFVPAESAEAAPLEIPRAKIWPADLGPSEASPAFDWIRDSKARAAAWLNTTGVEALAKEQFAADLMGTAPSGVAELHDKAFALGASRALDLDSAELLEASLVLSPEALSDPDEILRNLQQKLDLWPRWMKRRFTLKPRFGSSGRGRVGGQESVDTAAIRGALPRLQKTGGALFEPWLDRVTDLSVALFVPERAAKENFPTLLGSLEMWNRPSGAYAGHSGEVDSRGRVFSGDADDESLRADAAQIAGRARDRGFTGACGVDALRYRQPLDNSGSPRLRLRRAVEFNARPTMGLVTIGLVRRALPRVRERLDLSPGKRRGFALVHRDDADQAAWASRVHTRLGSETLILDLSSPASGPAPRPTLIFTVSRQALQDAKEELFES